MNGELRLFSAGCKQWRVNSCITVVSAAAFQTLLLFLIDLGVSFPFGYTRFPSKEDPKCNKKRDLSLNFAPYNSG